MKNRKPKPYWEMNTSELREATKEFDKEFVGDLFGPMTPETRRALARAKKRGRPRVGLGADKIRVSLEHGLRLRADRMAKRLGVSRSELIAKSLEAALAGR